MKKSLVFGAILFSLGFASHVLAQGFVPLAPIPGLTDVTTSDSATLATFLNNFYKYLVGLAAVVAVIQIIWAGLEIAVNKEDISGITAEKGKIRNAIFGLVLVLSPVLVFSIINPSILNLSLNLPEIKPVPTPPAPAVAIPDATNGSVPFADRTVTTPISGAWCSRDSGSQRLLCGKTKEECDAARNANALLMTGPCEFTPSP